MNLELVLEKGDGEWWGRLEGVPNAHLYTSGDTVDEVTENLRDLLADYLENEGQEESGWQSVLHATVEFNYTYDMTSFAEAFDALQAGVLAEKSGMEEVLVQEIVNGTRRPSLEQARRIEAALHEVGQSLLQVSMG